MFLLKKFRLKIAKLNLFSNLFLDDRWIDGCNTIEEDDLGRENIICINHQHLVKTVVQQMYICPKH